MPGVIYGGAKEVNFSAPATAFKTLVYTPDFQLAEIKVGGNSYRCILKDLQFDKVTDDLIHADFMELVEDKKVIATIPIKFTGAAKGVKDGGKLITKMKALKVKTFPKFLKENIEVDLTELELNGNVRVEDVKAENYEILNSPRIPIASSRADACAETGRGCRRSCCGCSCGGGRLLPALPSLLRVLLRLRGCCCCQAARAKNKFILSGSPVSS